MHFLVNSGLNTEPKQVYVGILRNTAMTFRILRVWSVKENAAELERRQSLQPSCFHSLGDL